MGLEVGQQASGGGITAAAGAKLVLFPDGEGTGGGAARQKEQPQARGVRGGGEALHGCRWFVMAVAAACSRREGP